MRKAVAVRPLWGRRHRTVGRRKVAVGSAVRTAAEHIVTRTTALRLQRQPGFQIARTVGVLRVAVSGVHRRVGLQGRDGLELAQAVPGWLRAEAAKALRVVA